MEEIGEKVTESKVEKLIYQHTSHVEALEELATLRLELAKAVADAVTLRAAKDAMEQRKDMLISLGAHLRDEGSNTELSIKKERAKEILRNKRK